MTYKRIDNLIKQIRKYAYYCKSDQEVIVLSGAFVMSAIKAKSSYGFVELKPNGSEYILGCKVYTLKDKDTNYLAIAYKTAYGELEQLTEIKEED